jgi:pimeloyl-ACP methyl ester carboxylesterase
VTADLRSADGRRLNVKTSGDPADHPVFFMHGTPGSRLEPFLGRRALRELGVWLISFDRPGYGGSDRREFRAVSDVASDVATIADDLGIGQFAVLGWSGGGPHALACAALLPGRVTRTAALASIAPWDAKGLDWLEDMAGSNVDAYTAAASDPGLLTARLVRDAAKIQADPASHMASLRAEMPEPDRQISVDERVDAVLARNFAEALRYSAGGWIDDVLAFVSPWGFDVSDIQVPVLLWHGESDVFSPTGHTRWLAERIPSAFTDIESSSAHFGAVEALPVALSWLVRPA